MLHPKPSNRNLLLLSGGSKVAIAKIALAACKKRGAALHISDTSPQVPCELVADHFSLLPSCEAESWKGQLIKLCESAEIGLIIPTRHSELKFLNEARADLEKVGTHISLSSRETLDICIHKTVTYNFLRDIGVPTPLTQSCKTGSIEGKLPGFPLIAKDPSGSSSVGVKTILDLEELSRIPPGWILQEKASGTEYTTNIYIDSQRQVICSIPHERITVESGEVVQAKTRRIPELIQLCETITVKLPGAQGIINIQAFVDHETGDIKIIEINPRIGGGYPLCDAAKGHYIEWLCQEYLDRKKLKAFDQWTEGLLMRRYREALFSL